VVGLISCELISHKLADSGRLTAASAAASDAACDADGLKLLLTTLMTKPWPQ